MDDWKKLRFRLYLELQVDVWLEMYLKIYLKSYLSFVCERIEKYLIFSINFVFIRNFSLVEIYGILGVWGVKRYGWLKKATVSIIFGVRGRYLASIISWYIISHIYYFSVSYYNKDKSIWMSKKSYGFDNIWS